MPPIILNTMFRMTSDFDRMMDAAKILKGCKTAADVVKLLGISENGDQLMTNWKSRGIPRARINEIAKKIGCNPFWLEDGDGIMEFVYAKTKAEASVLTAMQIMAAEHQEDSVATVVKVSNSLAEQAHPKHNGTQ